VSPASASLRAAAGVASLAFAALAHAGADEIRWDAQGHAAQEFKVLPGKFAEWCGKLQRGDKVQWRFEAMAPLDFNVHYHEGPDVRFPSRLAGLPRAEGVLEVAQDQDYCWMWTNSSAQAVQLKALLSRAR
jgi:hypothetical protein